ncbi:MAG TPA: hypothetical protein VKU77_31115 [Streptosporangiaceae bacterium]|nr:hypothetical protein [Streptosporangiaceae bacterium]
MEPAGARAAEARAAAVRAFRDAQDAGDSSRQARLAAALAKAWVFGVPDRGRRRGRARAACR